MPTVPRFERRIVMGSILLLCALLAAIVRVPFARSDALPAEILDALKQQEIAPANVSVYVHDLSSPAPLITLNERTPRNPASVIKLLTTLVALNTLGRDYTWRTEAYVRGRLRQGRLDGELIFKGYGDPYLTPEAFWQFIRGLRERGLREIDGDVLLDASHFEPPQADRGDFDGKPHRVYNALPHALSLNFQATRLHMYPDRGAGRVRVFTDPPLANLTIQNQLELVRAPCRRKHHRPVLVIADGEAGGTVKLHGSYSAECPESTFARLVMDPTQHVVGAFASMWHDVGGRHVGQVRSASLPDDARLYHSVESRPLGELVRGINKYSNNLMSRLLLLTLGAEVHGAPGTIENGRQVVVSWAHGGDIDLPALRMDNGSGLSRAARISAQGIGALLAAAYASPYMPEFMSSMSVAGVDGTMRRRLVGHGVSGHAHVKTGSLNDVGTMAGYVLDRNGRRWAVVLLINQDGLAAWRARPVQDTLLKWVYAAAYGDTPDRQHIVLDVQPAVVDPADS
jgi:D-alanyl-D-alanine carboxypeptidase/D-alanyl-D-alanine-endopeptidase (penicillin-binding protein 4)